MIAQLNGSRANFSASINSLGFIQRLKNTEYHKKLNRNNDTKKIQNNDKLLTHY